MVYQTFCRTSILWIFFLELAILQVKAQDVKPATLVAVDSGWAANSVNAVIFRKNSLASHKQVQYIAFYNSSKQVVLGKRKLGSTQWQLKTTPFRGNAADAHNSISIMTDGDGYLHIAWDHHNNKLNYSKSKEPGSLEMLSPLSMTGTQEGKVSYPEFYKLPSGDLVFFYRDGGSGNGNLVINRYQTKQKTWKQIQHNLVDGEGKRNAYWQACTDSKGSIHISWVWRESPDVASNHDLCYARSDDGGITWMKSTGEQYRLPINAATAEYACRIPQGSELINQTSMYADEEGKPFIATYWRDAQDSVPQYHLIYKSAKGWKLNNLGFRQTAFSLSGAGTKAIPISRPQVVVLTGTDRQKTLLIFRDSERGNKVSVATTENLDTNGWTLYDLNQDGVGAWEPTYDTELWKSGKLLHIFLQNVQQVDGEGTGALPAQMVSVLEWKPTI